MSLTAAERETSISMSDENDVAYIYTAQRKVLTRLRKNPAAKLIEEGNHGGSPWARFELPAGLISFRSRRTARELTDEERQVLADRARANFGKAV